MEDYRKSIIFKTIRGDIHGRSTAGLILRLKEEYRLRIERQINQSTVRLYIERHTIVISRDTDEDVDRVLRDIVAGLSEFLTEEKTPKKFWWEFMGG